MQIREMIYWLFLVLDDEIRSSDEMKMLIDLVHKTDHNCIYLQSPQIDCIR